MCIVVNKYKVNMDDPDIVYIGRGGKWGNPYSHKDGTRAQYRVSTVHQAIMEYRKYLWSQISDGFITLEMLKELDGKRLACYCAPNPCHGNIIKQAVQWAKEQK